MKVLIASHDMTPIEIYKHSKNQGMEKMSNHIGEEIEIKSFLLYEDKNKRTEETQTILTLHTMDGDYLATNSKIFIESFSDIVSIFGEPSEIVGQTFKIVGGESKNGRPYVNCALV